jgi:RimJ/RimL family protein N-acetyltransferase
MSERDKHIVLETPRLRLRQFTPDDASRLFDLNSDPEVMRFLGPAPSLEALRDEIIPFHLAVYQQFDRLGTWAAEERTTSEFLGWFHFRAGPGQDARNVDLGYRMRRATWNKGYATEGSAALIEMGFSELGVERVFAHTMTVNTASRRVMEKCGLTLVRTAPYDGPGPVEGAEHGEVEYAITRAEWEAYAARGTK